MTEKEDEFPSIGKFIVTIHNPSPYIRKTARQVVLSRCYTANFAHIWGGGSIRATLRIR